MRLRGQLLLLHAALALGLDCRQVQDVYDAKACCGDPEKHVHGLTCGDIKAAYRREGCCPRQGGHDDQTLVFPEFTRATGIGVPYESTYYDFASEYPMTECNTPEEFALRDAAGAPSAAIAARVAELSAAHPMTVIRPDGGAERLASYDARAILDSAVPRSERVKMYQVHGNCTMDRSDAFEYGRAELRTAIHHAIGFFNARGFPSATSDRVYGADNADFFVQIVDGEYFMIDFRKLETHRTLRFFTGYDAEIVQTRWFDVDSDAFEVSVSTDEAAFAARPAGESRALYDAAVGVLRFDVRNAIGGYYYTHSFPSAEIETSARVWRFECAMRFVANDAHGRPQPRTLAAHADYLVQFSETCELTIDRKTRGTGPSPPPSPPPPPAFPQTEGCECSSPTDDPATSCMGTDANGNRVPLCDQETHDGAEWTPSVNCRCGCGVFNNNNGWSSGDQPFCYLKGNADSCPGALASGWKPVFYIVGCGAAPPPPPYVVSEDGFDRTTQSFALATTSQKYAGLHMVPWGNKRGLDVYVGRPLGGSASSLSAKSHTTASLSDNDFSTWNETQSRSQVWQKLFVDFNTTYFHKMFVRFRSGSLPLAGAPVPDDVFEEVETTEAVQRSLNLLVGHEYFHNLQFSALQRNGGTEFESHAVVTEYGPGGVPGALSDDRVEFAGLRLWGHAAWLYNTYRGYGWNGMRYYDSYLAAQPQYTPQRAHEVFADGQFSFYGHTFPIWLKARYDRNMQVLKHLYHNTVDDMKELEALRVAYAGSSLVAFDPALGGTLASPSVAAYNYKRAIRTVLDRDVEDVYTEYIIAMTLLTNRPNVPERYRLPEQLPFWLLTERAPLAVRNKFARYGPSEWDEARQTRVFTYEGVFRPELYDHFERDAPFPIPPPSNFVRDAPQAARFVNSTMIPHWPKLVDNAMTSRAPHVFDDAVPHAPAFTVGLASLTSYVVTLPRTMDSVTIAVDDASEVQPPQTATGVVVLSHSAAAGLTLSGPLVSREASVTVDLTAFQQTDEPVRLIVSNLAIPVSRYYRRGEFDRSERPPVVYRLTGGFPSPPPSPPAAPPSAQITELTPIVGGAGSAGCAFAYSGAGYPNPAYTDFAFDESSDFVYGGVLDCTKDGGVALNPARYSLRPDGHQYWIQRNVSTPYGTYHFFAARVHGPIVFDGTQYDMSASHVFYADASLPPAEVESLICESSGWGPTAGAMVGVDDALLCPDALSERFPTWRLQSACCKTVYSDWGTFEYQGTLDCNTDRTKPYYDFEPNMTEWWSTSDGTYFTTIVKKNGGFYNQIFGANALQPTGYVGIYYEQIDAQTPEYWRARMCEGYAFGNAFLPDGRNCPTQLSALASTPTLSCAPP